MTERAIIFAGLIVLAFVVVFFTIDHVSLDTQAVRDFCPDFIRGNSRYFCPMDNGELREIICTYDEADDCYWLSNLKEVQK